MTVPTAARVVSNIFRIPVCIRNGSSSAIRNWLNWMPKPGWKVEIRYVSRAISVTVESMFASSVASLGSRDQRRDAVVGRPQPAAELALLREVLEQERRRIALRHVVLRLARVGRGLGVLVGEARVRPAGEANQERRRRQLLEERLGPAREAHGLVAGGAHDHP